MIPTLASFQVIQATIQDAWDFFSDPRNLAKITPPELEPRPFRDRVERWKRAPISRPADPHGGIASDWHLVRLGTRAVGGADPIIEEATAVSPDGNG